jgi:hypothetical protein
MNPGLPRSVRPIHSLGTLFFVSRKTRVQWHKKELKMHAGSCLLQSVLMQVPAMYVEQPYHVQQYFDRAAHHGEMAKGRIQCTPSFRAHSSKYIISKFTILPSQGMFYLDLKDT